MGRAEGGVQGGGSHCYFLLFEEPLFAGDIITQHH